MSWKISATAPIVVIPLLEERLTSLGNEETAVSISHIGDNPDQWLIEAYYSTKPNLGPNSSRIPKGFTLEKLSPQDWVSISQEGLKLFRIGRFRIATSTYDKKPDINQYPLIIDAGLAFGTGHHATTRGCLTFLNDMSRKRRHPRRIIDIGTGSGILALAAARAWPQAKILASDVDPIAVSTARDNLQVNHLGVGYGPKSVRLIAATGLRHREIKRFAPVDLIFANILAHPLIKLADAITQSLRPGGTAILAGLLTTQAKHVINAYRSRGLIPTRHLRLGEWSIVMLRRKSG